VHANSEKTESAGLIGVGPMSRVDGALQWIVAYDMNCFMIEGTFKKDQVIKLHALTAIFPPLHVNFIWM